MSETEIGKYRNLWKINHEQISWKEHKQLQIKCWELFSALYDQLRLKFNKRNNYSHLR
jgi:hypothetical protein